MFILIIAVYATKKMLILLKAIQLHRYLTELHDLKYTECIEELSN